MLELDDLHVAYGDVRALDGLSFTVPEGEVFGFLGTNGAGKTTAMRVVFGIVLADAGEVRWNGRRVGPPDRLRFGYMPEERGLYPSMRVRDQLVHLGRLHGLSADDARSRAGQWLELLGLGDKGGARVDSLSLGNQQRVQLVTALLHEPDLLVLDEPFSGLDPVGVEALAGVLRDRAQRGATVVFSSHQLDLVEHICTSVAVVSKGRTVSAGTVDALTSAGAVLVVGVDADPGWAAALPGVMVVSAEGRRLRLRLAPGLDPQSVLRAAATAGPVTHFAFERRRLSELFREAVTSGVPPGVPA
jgi:ABC-2 type transport system ATP-binding protein